LATGPLSEKVFTPLLLEGGALAGSLGRIFGVGSGRGIGLMFSTFGMIYFFAAQLIFFDKRIRRVELEIPDSVPVTSEDTEE